MNDFCNRLKEAIDEAGLTQAALAQQIGVHPNLVSSWVSGKSLPSVPHLAQLVSSLRADAGWLLLGAAPKQTRDSQLATEVRRLGGDLIKLVDMARNSG